MILIVYWLWLRIRKTAGEGSEINLKLLNENQMISAISFDMLLFLLPGDKLFCKFLTWEELQGKELN